MSMQQKAELKCIACGGKQGFLTDMITKNVCMYSWSGDLMARAPGAVTEANRRCIQCGHNVTVPWKAPKVVAA